MIVAERGAHLAGGEVEDAAAAVVEEVRALRPLDEERREIADVADHVALDRILQLSPAFPPVLRAAGCFLVHRRALLPCGHPAAGPARQQPRRSARSRKSDATTSNGCSAARSVDLPRAMLGRPGDEGGAKAERARGLEVGVVGGDHHAPVRREAEQIGGAEIGGGQRFVRAGDLGAEDRVPRQPRAPGHVDQQRHVAVGQGGEDEAPLQPGQALDRIRPRLEPMPGAVQMLDLVRPAVRRGRTHRARPKVLAMQVIEPDPRAAAAAHLLHRGLIERAPAIGDGLPVALDAARAEEAAQLARDAAAPVDHRAEHVKRERGDLVQGHGLVSRSERVLGGNPRVRQIGERADHDVQCRSAAGPPRDRPASAQSLKPGGSIAQRCRRIRLSPARQPAGGGTSRCR